MADRIQEDSAPVQPAVQPEEPVSAPPAAVAGPMSAGPGSGMGAARVIALQSAAGNAAVSRMLSGGDAAQSARSGMSGGGGPLDDRVRDRFEPAFGADFSGVRVHTDGQAAGAAQALDARAYTVGGDIVFNRGEYAPGSEAGQALIAHELAHVVQQGPAGALPDELEVSQPGDATEREADAAASAAMSGAPAAVSQAPAGAARKRIARFAQGTTRIENNQYLGGTGHAAMTEEALHAMGLDPAAARAGRQGNWMRDLSQALTPGILVKIGGAERIFAILNVLSIKEFGRGFTAGEFGTYDPVEHIDNPTDLRASDVNRQVAPGTSGAEALANPANPDAYRTTQDVLDNPAGTENQGYASVDPRYAATAGANLTPGETTAAFQVNENAIPRYMNTSKEWLKGKMHQAARAGRTGQGGLGPREFASGIHTMQDYYAHSNFCEIAINLLLREGADVFVPAGAGPVGPHPEDTPGGVQRINAAQAGVLDTMVHQTDAQGDPLAANMMVNGLEVMTTGSFNMTDTAASLLEEAADKLKEMNPFEKGKKGPSEVTLAALDYMEMDPENPADFSGVGQWVAEKIRSINTVVTAVTDTGAAITEGAGELVGSGISGAADVAGGFFGGLSAINEALGGSAGYWDEEQHAVEGAGASAAGAVTGLTGEAAAAIRGISESIEAYAADWADDQHSLRKAYTWVYEHGPLKALKEAAKAIPVVGEEIAKGIEEVDKEIRDYLEEKLGAAWNETVTKAMQVLNAAIQVIREQTNIDKKRHQQVDGPLGPVIKALGGVGDLYGPDGRPLEGTGIAPSTYNPPSHTEIAKDHGDIVNPVSDQHADEDHEGDEHGHTHISSYLAPLAGAMGSKASKALGAQVAIAWDEVERGGQPSEVALTGIDQAVDHWFNHPATNKPDWEAEFRDALRGPRIGAMVYQRLNRARGGS